MKIQIEKVTATTEEQNNGIIRAVSLAIHGITTIDEAYEILEPCLRIARTFHCGRGGHHIWVSNRKNERLMLITETSK